MRRLVILLLVLLPAWPAVGEEKAGTTCDLQALLDPDDAGLLVAYDGLRKGLEIARLPRVCRHDPAPDTGGVAGFLERRAMAAAPLRENGKRIEPFFAIGDASCAAVQKAGTRLPCVMAVTRYTVKRRPLVRMPSAEHGTVVYADVSVERILAVLRGMWGHGADYDRGRSPDVLNDVFAGPPNYPGHEFALSPEDPAVRASIEAVLGKPIASAARAAAKTAFHKMGRESLPRVGVHQHPLLFLRFDAQASSGAFAAAVKRSRDLRRPLISDNRAHFGLGAVVVIVPRHDLLGKAAADEGRKLRAGGTPRKEPRAVPGFEVWVDLAAADAIGFELPLAFLARADRIKRARRPAPGATR